MSFFFFFFFLIVRIVRCRIANLWGISHTVDERISVVAHIRVVQWYSMFIRNMDVAEL